MSIIMDYFIKAHFENENECIKLSMPISKVDVEKRIVSGFATLDNVDRQGDLVLTDASLKAFEKFRGNVRLMHQPIPAGKVVSFRQNDFFDPETNKTYTGVFVDAYISKGAENIWQMVIDGTLTGFSIGGRATDTEVAVDEDSGDPYRIIKEYELSELSLVDTPANQLANIFSIQKTDNGFVLDGIFNKSNIQNVFWCEVDKKAYLSDNDSHSCVFCKNDTQSIGWIDEVDENGIAKAVQSIIKANKLEKDVIASPPATAKKPVQGVKSGLPKKKVKKKIVWKADNSPINVGDFVAYKNGKSLIKGKVVKIVKSGTYRDKNTQEKRIATEDNPIGIINVYNHDKTKHSASNKSVARHLSETKKLKVSTVSNSSKKAEPHDSGHQIEQKVTIKEGGKMKKRFFSALWGKKEEIVLPTETQLVEKALVDNILKKSFENTNEGGVEMAENTDSHEELDTTQADETTETVETEEVEFEIEETVEEVTEETSDVVEKSHDPEEETVDAENAPEEVEITKALDEIKSFIGDSISKSVSSTNDSLSKIGTVVEGLAKSFDDKVSTLQAKYEEIEKGLAVIANRVESVENDTAIKKSGEFEGSLPEASNGENSIWGGRFLGTDKIFN